MFREIRKKKNEINIVMAKLLLESSRRGVLAVNGDDGYPYAIPINYVYDGEAQRICFHGAKIGHKVDALRACDKVCFTVFDYIFAYHRFRAIEKRKQTDYSSYKTNRI